MAAVLDGLSASAVGTGESQAVGLGVLRRAMLAVSVDGTVLSVALPTLAIVLHASESDLQWFSSGYFLVLAAAMLPAVQADLRARNGHGAPGVSRHCAGGHRLHPALPAGVERPEEGCAAGHGQTVRLPGSSRQLPVRLRERKMAKTLAAMHGFCGKAKRRR